MTRTHPAARFLVACTLCVPFAARAQSSGPGPFDLHQVHDIAELSLEQLLNSPIEVASKREQCANEAPADISVITSEEIELYGYRTLAEILNTLRDFHVTNDRSYEYIGVRGIALPGDYNTRILLLVDGHRANDNVYDSMAVGLDAPIDVGAIERVEVMRGPGSSLYGSNAFLAVVNVVTRSGSFEKVRAQAETGVQASPAQYDSTRGWLLGGHRLRSGLEAFAALSASHRFGTRRLYFPAFDDPATNNGVSVDKDGENAQNAFLELGYGNLRLRTGYARRAKAEPAASFDTIFNDSRTRIVDTRAFADLGYRRRLEGPRLALSAHGTLDYYHYQGTYPYATTLPDGQPGSVTNIDDVESVAWGAEGQATKTWIEHAGILSELSTTVGVEYQNRARIKQWNGSRETGEVLLDRNDHSQFLAVFAMQEATLAERVTLGAGLRYDQWIAYHHALSPRVTLNVAPTATTRVKLMVGSAFRAANAYERFYGIANSASAGQGDYVANPGIRPESIDSYELVVVQTLSSRLRLLGSAYLSRMHDLIALYTDPASGALSFQNLAEVKAHGAGLELEGAWPAVRFRVSYQVQDATWTEAGTATRTLANSPHHMVKGRLAVPLLRERMHLFTEGWFLSERDSVHSLAGTAARVPGYAQVNLGGTFKIKPALSLQLVARNVTNQKHRDPASEEFREPDLPEEGLSLWLRLRYDLALARQ